MVRTKQLARVSTSDYTRVHSERVRKLEERNAKIIAGSKEETKRKKPTKMAKSKKKVYSTGCLFFVQPVSGQPSLYFAKGVNAKELDEMQLKDPKLLQDYVAENQKNWDCHTLVYSLSMECDYRVERMFFVIFQPDQ